MINITTIPGGIILKEQDRFFAFDQFPSGYQIINDIQTYVEFIDGVLVFDCTNVSVNDITYTTIEEFITAIGL
jgi:hypothetical protein